MHVGLSVRVEEVLLGSGLHGLNAAPRFGLLLVDDAALIILFLNVFLGAPMALVVVIFLLTPDHARG